MGNCATNLSVEEWYFNLMFIIIFAARWGNLISASLGLFPGSDYGLRNIGKSKK